MVPDINSMEWWEHPATAYAKGLQDGAKLARDQAYAEMAAVFVGMFRAQGQDFAEAWRRHLAAKEAVDRRRAWDAAAASPRDGDLRGRAA